MPSCKCATSTFGWEKCSCTAATAPSAAFDLLNPPPRTTLSATCKRTQAVMRMHVLPSSAVIEGLACRQTDCWGLYVILARSAAPRKPTLYLAEDLRSGICVLHAVVTSCHRRFAAMLPSQRRCRSSNCVST